MLEKLAKSIEEVNVLAEHYRTCQNVAAIKSKRVHIGYETIICKALKSRNNLTGQVKL